jgi:riboflavin kinase/FMN adenylyltransferase
VLALPFEKELAEMSAERFVTDVLAGRLRVNQMIVGYDARFGRGGAGNAALLEDMGARLGFTTKKVNAVKAGGLPISSTAIRKLLEKGETEAAARLLGRPYTVEGKVVKGLGIGRKMGFPTANIKTDPMKLIPANGIYAAWCRTPQGRKPAAVSIGLRPTIPLEKPPLTLEAHVIDFDGDLYGSKITIEFARFLRPERKYENIKLLAEQIRKDVELAKKILSG